MPVKNAVAKNWSQWVRGADDYLRSDDPSGTYGSYTPQLPTLYTTTYSAPTGNTWTATNTSSASVAGTGTGNRTDCSLNYALTNCALNDTIVMTAGATYTGTYTIPNKLTGSGWVYVISSALASLPAAGTRVAPADAANMPLMVAPSAAAKTIDSTASSHHFRFVGIEIKSASTTADPLQTGVVWLANGDVSDSTVCDNIIFDRCCIHGSADGAHSGRRGVMLAGTNLAVIDSYVSGFYDDGNDSQAIWMYQGNGPFKVVNNYIEGASENLMAGGEDPSITNSVPQDIEIRHNSFFKPLGWIGAGHNVKNLLEFKNARRVLVEGNLFENCWPDGQAGYAFLITPRNQSAGAPWCIVADVTIRLNKFFNCGQWFTLTGQDINPAAPTQLGYRILIENNLVDVTGLSSADAKLCLIINAPDYLTIQHNTGFSVGGGSAAYLYSTNPTKAVTFKFQDNIFSNATNGSIAAGQTDGTTALNSQYTSGRTYTKNAIIGGTSGNYVAPDTGNFFPVNMAAVGFTDIAGAFAANNYTLTGASPYHNAASDGTDVGCDIAALNAAIA